MAEGIRLSTPMGRIVQGHPTKGEVVKDKAGVEQTWQDGTKKLSFFIGLAIPKNDPAWPMLKKQIEDKAKADRPECFGQNGAALRPDFAWKITDGDSAVPNRNNKIPNQKEGFPGHWILSFSTMFAPSLVDGQYQDLMPNQIKKGDYVKVSFTCRANDSTESPGVYLNHDFIMLVQEGQEITSKPSAQEAFGGAPAAQTPAAPVQQAQPPADTAPAQTPAANAAPVVQPANDFLNGPQGGAPAPQSAAPAAPVAPVADQVKYLCPSDNQWYTKDQLLAGNWSEAAINNLQQMSV